MRPWLAILIFLLVGPAGCIKATHPLPSYGNFIPNSPENYEQTMATDAAKKLLVVYPPASTWFELGEEPSDPFGLLLVDSLRTQGYAIAESNPALCASGRESDRDTIIVTPLAPSLLLRYILDQTGESNLYRLTLVIGNQSLTRAYQEQKGSLAPAGAWVHKE